MISTIQNYFSSTKLSPDCKAYFNSHPKLWTSVQFSNRNIKYIRDRNSNNNNSSNNIMVEIVVHVTYIICFHLHNNPLRVTILCILPWTRLRIRMIKQHAQCQKNSKGKYGDLNWLLNSTASKTKFTYNKTCFSPLFKAHLMTSASTHHSHFKSKRQLWPFHLQ